MTCFFYKTGAGTALVSWLLLGIDDLGMQLEQPYTVMALKSMCEDVQDEVVPETGRSEWTPRIGAPRDEVKASVRLFYLIFVWAIRLTCNFFLNRGSSTRSWSATRRRTRRRSWRARDVHKR